MSRRIIHSALISLLECGHASTRTHTTCCQSTRYRANLHPDAHCNASSIALAALAALAVTAAEKSGCCSGRGSRSCWRECHCCICTCTCVKHTDAVYTHPPCTHLAWAPGRGAIVPDWQAAWFLVDHPHVRQDSLHVDANCAVPLRPRPLHGHVRASLATVHRHQGQRPAADTACVRPTPLSPSAKGICNPPSLTHPSPIPT